MHRTHRRYALLAIGAALIAACDRDTLMEPRVEEAPPAAELALTPTPETEYPHEAEFHRLSREIAGYGGHFFDEQGDLIVHLTDPAEADRARPILEPLLGTRLLSVGATAPASPGVIVVRQADFTFPQLAAWRDRASEVLPEEGVEFTDLDEVQNRVVIGVSTLGGRMAATRTLRQRGVPVEAILFEATQPVVPDQSLKQPFLPLRGGFQVQGTHQDLNDWLGACTLGFNARWNGIWVFLTNSHCTRAFWGTDGTIFHQPHPEQPVGQEIFDRAGIPCPGVLHSFRCRWSDAAIIRTYSEVIPQDFAIARTTFRATGDGNPGSLTVDQTNPRIPILGELASPVVNQTLDKIGRSTGWTYGQVERTCVNVIPPPDVLGRVILRCQTFIRNMHTAGGDSGSPVFLFYWLTPIPGAVQQAARLAGLHWGWYEFSGGKRVAIMSPMENIRMDFGPLTTF